MFVRFDAPVPHLAAQSSSRLLGLTVYRCISDDGPPRAKQSSWLGDGENSGKTNGRNLIC